MSNIKIIYALMACHNRIDSTLSALASLHSSANYAHAALSLTIYDDGSTDATTEKVKAAFPEATVISGDGTAYWAKGMSIAERYVLNNPELDPKGILLWVNNDVTVHLRAIRTLIETMGDGENTIAVGAVADPTSGEVTYSGLRRSGLHPLRFCRVQPGIKAKRLQTFNGNIVAVPIAVAKRLGGIEGRFSHALADIDYGLRCGYMGVETTLAPGIQGLCSANPPLDQSRVNFLAAWREFTGPKGGGHLASNHLFLTRHAGWRAYPAMSMTYMLWLFRQLRARSFDSTILAAKDASGVMKTNVGLGLLIKSFRIAESHWRKGRLRRHGVAIGDGSMITGGLLVYRHPRSTISFGKGVVLNAAASRNTLEARGPNILRTNGPSAQIRVGNNSGITSSTISAFSTVDIGERVLIGAGVLLTDSDHHLVKTAEGKPRRFAGAPKPLSADSIHIEDDVFIGARSVILKGVTIGRNSVIGAGSVVARDIPKNVVAAGNPCVVVKAL